MSSLTLVIGRATASRQSPPFPIYVGESGSAANAAMERSAAATFEIFRSVHGLRKNNPRSAVNAARLIAEGQAAFDSATAMATQLSELTEEHVALKATAAQLADAKAELESTVLGLRRNADAQAASIASAASEIEALKAQLAAIPATPPAKKAKS